MTTRALVLGGGGTVGIAWEVGVLHGLQSSGIDITSYDLIIGTSAGSVVGAQLALGMSLDVLLALQTAPLDQTQDRPAPSDAPVLAAVTQTLAVPAHAMTHEVMREVGRLALAAAVGSEEAYLVRFALLQGIPWPERPLLITSIDVASGALHPWQRSDAASLQQAVAASCAVPGIFPPVTIDGRHYMDGGMRSGTSADLARTCDAVLVIAPLTTTAPDLEPESATHLGLEVALLRSEGRRVVIITPDAEALATFGPSMMDTTRRIEAAQTGLRQGSAAAHQVRQIST